MHVALGMKSSGSSMTAGLHAGWRLLRVIEQELFASIKRTSLIYWACSEEWRLQGKHGHVSRPSVVYRGRLQG